jgi:hypothetical protein
MMRYVVAPVLAGSTSLAVLNDQSYAKQTYLNDDTLFVRCDCFYEYGKTVANSAIDSI